MKSRSWILLVNGGRENAKESEDGSPEPMLRKLKK